MLLEIAKKIIPFVSQKYTRNEFTGRCIKFFFVAERPTAVLFQQWSGVRKFHQLSLYNYLDSFKIKFTLPFKFYRPINNASPPCSAAITTTQTATNRETDLQDADYATRCNQIAKGVVITPKDPECDKCKPFPWSKGRTFGSQVAQRVSKQG